MPPLEQTLSSMSLSLSLHSNNNDNDTYHHMKHSSVSRQTKRHSITGSSTTSILPGKSKGNTPITTNISTTTTTTTEQRMMNELRTAKDGCIGSIMALLHFLSQHGVAASSICEETKQLKRISEQQQQQEMIASHTTILTQSSSSTTTSTLSTIPYESMVRKIIKYYLVCINKHIREVQEVDTIHMLLLGCWQTQYRYAKIQYLYAHQYYNTIRFKNTNNSTINTTNNTNYTIKQQQQQQNQQQQQQGTTIITSSSYQYCDNKSTVLKKALQYQIQMAEYVCTCQKEILSCQRKYERQQQQQQRQQVQLQ